MYTPVNAETTFRLNVQVAPAASVAPVRVILLLPAVAVIVPPPQDPFSAFGVATFRPVGRVSVKEIPVNVTMAFGFVIEKLTLTGWPTGTATAPNVLLRTGGFATNSVAVAVLPGPPFVEVTATELTKMPSGAVTFAVTVQTAEAASVPPERLIVPDPAVAVATPPQVEVKPLGVATTTPAGSVSVKATPVSAAKEFGLVIVKVTVLVPPGTILAGVKVLLITGGIRTVTVDVAVFPSRL